MRLFYEELLLYRDVRKWLAEKDQPRSVAFPRLVSFESDELFLRLRPPGALLRLGGPSSLLGELAYQPFALKQAWASRRSGGSERGRVWCTDASGEPGDTAR